MFFWAEKCFVRFKISYLKVILANFFFFFHHEPEGSMYSALEIPTLKPFLSVSLGSSSFPKSGRRTTEPEL